MRVWTQGDELHKTVAIFSRGDRQSGKACWIHTAALAAKRDEERVEEGCVQCRFGWGGVSA